MKLIKGLTALTVLCSFGFAQAYTNTFKLSTENKAKEVAFRNLPAMRIHHKTVEEYLNEKVNIVAMKMVTETEYSIVPIGNGHKAEAEKSIDQALGTLKELSKDTSLSDLQVVEFHIEFVNEAPYHLQDIKKIRKEIHRAYLTENFPLTRIKLASLESEMHMQTFKVSLKTYQEALTEAKALVKKGSFDDAKNILNKVLTSVTVEDWGIPLPYVEAEAAITQAMNLVSMNAGLAKEKVELAEYHLKRAYELGYVAGDKEDFDNLKKDISRAKKEIFKKNFREPYLEKIHGHFISFIKKYMVPKGQEIKQVAQK